MQLPYILLFIYFFKISNVKSQYIQLNFGILNLNIIKFQSKILVKQEISCYNFTVPHFTDLISFNHSRPDQEVIFNHITDCNDFDIDENCIFIGSGIQNLDKCKNITSYYLPNR